ncbi:hypothetical protein G7059_03685 [Erysipelothrix sp. HDW6A]|uniref:hypothetical protein n=1 Tax=Erysipelothrix sp. HDW6A TaxID=2714928 RepID=UPI00140A17F0|nr:hypothetical protein [Erysipelothrix sp. HDW6A]QIK57013.1 hypothetical protein G7059_03685 [Erysipelothrix sp. HDW6A]
MSNILEACYWSWSVGFRDAFGSFDSFRKTLLAEQYISHGNDAFYLELICLQEDDVTLYIVASSLFTLYASKNKDLATEVFYDFKNTYKQLEKKEIL